MLRGILSLTCLISVVCMIPACIRTMSLSLPSSEVTYSAAFVESRAGSRQVWVILEEPDGSARALLAISRAGSALGAWNAGHVELRSCTCVPAIVGEVKELAGRVVRSSAGADVIVLDDPDSWSDSARQDLWSSLPSDWALRECGWIATATTR